MNHLRALPIAAALFAASASADAYTLRNTDAGERVRWRVERVELVADPSLEALGKRSKEAASAAASAWSKADGAPKLRVKAGTADAIGYLPGGENHSSIRFEQNGWEAAGDALAVTVLTYKSDGGIVDADVVVNGGPARPFGEMTDDPGPYGTLAASQSAPYDLQNVLTHELGHVLGLGEEPVIEDATMFPTSGRGEVKKRDIDDDDALGVADLYSPMETTVEQIPACSAPRAQLRSGLSFAALAFALSCVARARRAAATRRKIAWVGSAILGALLIVVARRPLLAAQLAGTADAPPSQVVAAQARREGGLIVTRLVLRSRACPSCAPTEEVVDAPGGTLDGFTQVVGDARVPGVGATLRAGDLRVRLPVRHD
jgi:hypothetical protein